MKIYSAQFKGTTTVATGSNVDLTGSFSGSIAGIDINATNQFTASTSTRLTNIEIISASNINRITSLETKSASVDISISNINSVTASNIARLSNLETKSSSVDISVSNINSFTASNGNTSLNLLTGSLATTGSNSFFGTQVFSGSVFIANDLIVQGSSSIQYISASSVSIGTNIVQLNTATPSVRFAGLSVQDSGSSAGVTGSMLWDSLCNRWIYSNPSTIGYSGGMLLSGPRASTLGSETPLTCNYIAKSGGGDHLYDSCIQDVSGSVTIGGTLCTSGVVCGASGIFSSTSYSNLYVDGTNATGWGNNIAFRSQGTDFGYIGSVGSLLGNTTKDMTLWSTAGNGFRVYTNGNNLRLTITDGGSIVTGLITPKYDWYTQAYSGLQINGATTVWGRASDSHFSSNYYVKCCSTNGIASDTYIANGYANDFWFDNNAGQLRYRVGACGLADTAISWTTPFQICPNGYTSINTTTDGFAMLCLVSTGGDAGMYLRGGATNGGGWTMQAQNGCNLVFVDRTAGANPVRMTIASGGNIGIGCTAPDIKLVLVAPSSNTSLMAIRSTTGNNLFNFISNGTQGHGIIDMGRCTESGTFAPGFVRLRTDGDSWIQGGNLGIRTVTPQQPLHVDQGIASVNQGIPATSGTTQKGIVRLTPGQGIYGETLDIGMNVGPTYAWLQASNTADLAVCYSLTLNPNGGNVGIGTKSPSRKLTVSQGTGTNTNSYMSFDNSTERWVIGNEGGFSGGTSNDFIIYDTAYRLVVKAGGNVGIGTTSPNNKLEVQKTGNGVAAIFINQCSSDEATIRFKSTHDANSDYRVGASILVGSAFEIYHVNCAVNRFWISACGAIMMGTGIDTAINSSDPVHKIGPNTGGTSYARLMIQERTGCWISFNNGSGTNYGVIQVSGAGVSYGSNSDYRLKTNIQNMVSSCGLNRIMCLRPVTFDWIHHCIQGEGFIAHELQEYIPSAVSGEKDAVNETGCASYQTVDAKNIVPSLVKAIQEQQCTINLLKSCLGIN